MSLSAATMINHSGDITHAITRYLSDQYMNTAGINRAWRSSFGELSRVTRGVDEHTTVDQFIHHLETGYGRGVTVPDSQPGVYMPPVKQSYGVDPCNIAASLGRTDLLLAAYDKGLAVKSTKTCEAAAASGRLETLQFLRFMECPWDEYTSNAAAFNGHIEVLMWCIENGCPSNNVTTLNAASSGNLEMVKWLNRNWHNINSSIVTAATYAGSIPIIDWARRMGFVYTSTFADAVEVGDMRVLRYLLETRHPWDRDQIIDRMGYYMVSPKVEQWLYANGYIV